MTRNLRLKQKKIYLKAFSGSFISTEVKSAKLFMIKGVKLVGRGRDHKSTPVFNELEEVANRFLQTLQNFLCLLSY